MSAHPSIDGNNGRPRGGGVPSAAGNKPFPQNGGGSGSHASAGTVVATTMVAAMHLSETKPHRRRGKVAHYV